MGLTAIDLMRTHTRGHQTILMFSLYTMSKFKACASNNVQLDGGTLREVFDDLTGDGSELGDARSCAQLLPPTHFLRTKSLGGA